jgi:hypothetical protein
VPGHVLPGRPALQHARRPGEEADLVDRGRDLLGGRQRARLAGVADLQVDQLVRARLDRVGDAQQREAALGRGRVPPALERGRGGLTGGVDVRRPGQRRLGEDLAGDRVDRR